MMQERQYAFRQRLNEVHKPGRRNPHVCPTADELVLDERWSIQVADASSRPLALSAADLQAYLRISMGVSVPVGVREADAGRVILLGTRAEMPEDAPREQTSGSYRLQTSPTRIVLCGHDARGALQGGFYLEDLMNLRQAPLLPARSDCTRAPLFSPRMVHSGWGLDRFPDAHLSAIAHAGMDAVLLFVTGVNQTPHGHEDFNDLIDRAQLYGLDVYFYSYLHSRLHPRHPDARAFYEQTYGRLFEACPGARGIVFVGESCEFPSLDPQTTGRLLNDPPPDGRPDPRPSPGWWPCNDFPEWIDLVKEVIRQHSPQADFVFWTYNWGYAPVEPRQALLRALPRDLSVQVTFEMFEQVQRENTTGVCVDYTISFEGPGRYFVSEAEAAAERGLPLYAMTNTAGLTWDFGVVPYEPVPLQWMRRFQAVLDARRRWGLKGLMESHHYGFWPSVVSELAKWAFWSPAVDLQALLQSMAERDFGAEGAAFAIQAWQLWSDAIRHYVPTNEDQYGPFRVGPSYPLVFKPRLSRTFRNAAPSMPDQPGAHFGGRIVLTDYQPLDDPRQSPGASRVRVELRSLERMLQTWTRGTAAMRQAAVFAGGSRQTEARRALLLGEFIERMIVTTIHTKRWWMLNADLLSEADPGKAGKILTRMEEVARAEIENARSAIPLVEEDSRLGWEPSMEYMTDRAHLEWKIATVQTVLDAHIPAYRQALDLTRPASSRPRDDAQDGLSATPK